jgi:hypothetical protein
MIRRLAKFGGLGFPVCEAHGGSFVDSVFRRSYDCDVESQIDAAVVG